MSYVGYVSQRVPVQGRQNLTVTLGEDNTNMKTKSMKYFLAAGLVCCSITATLNSCSDILDEQPRTQFDPTFFNTKTGIEGGLTSLYAHLRYFYGISGTYLTDKRHLSDRQEAYSSYLHHGICPHRFL